MKLDAFTRAYIEAALWSTNDQSDEQGGEPLDANYGPGDIAHETMELIVADCADFQKRFGHLIEDDDPRGLHGEYDRWELAGHDFWLTREGHGAGFWDGDWPKHGDELTEAARSYGGFDLYVGDDGEIYGPPPDQYRHPPEWLAKRHPSRGRAGRSEERRAPRSHAVRDFRSIDELVEHAQQQDGATHVLILGKNSVLFYPTGRYWPNGEPQYEAGKIWQQGGYWHSVAPAKRTPLTGGLPGGTQAIDDYLGHRRTAEPARGGVVRDYIAVDGRGRKVAGPFHDYHDAKREADAAGGFVKFATEQAPRGATEARRRAPKMTPQATMDLAGKLAEEVGGNRPKAVPGGFRWSEKNESAQFTTYSPEYDQKVVCVVSIFEDGSVALNFFSDEGLSGTSTYENISGFSYASTDIHFQQMVEDINWVRTTVDGYAASWQQPEAGVDEAIHGYNIEVVYPDEQFARKHESAIGHLIQKPLVSQGALRDGYRMEYGPINRDDYRRLEGAIYSKLGNAVRVRLVQVAYAGGRSDEARRPRSAHNPIHRPRAARGTRRKR